MAFDDRGCFTGNGDHSGPSGVNNTCESCFEARGPRFLRREVGDRASKLAQGFRGCVGSGTYVIERKWYLTRTECLVREPESQDDA